MPNFTAGYLGGHPDAPKAIEDGYLVVNDDGLSFRHTATVNMMPTEVMDLSFTQDELRGITVAAGTMKRKGRGMAIAMGGLAGAAVHSKTRGKQTTPLLVLVERDGRFATCRFVTDVDGAHTIVSVLNDARRNSGRGALPTVENA